MFRQRLKRHLSTWGKLFNIKVVNLNPLFRILILQKCRKMILILTCPFMDWAHFSITIGFTSSIKVLLDLFLSVDGSSNWSFSIWAYQLIFIERPKVENRNCSCFINFQTKFSLR